jgi:hypothetical protein
MFINDLFLKEAEVNHNTSAGTGSSIISANPDGYASEEDDQSILKLSDLRKTRLTLGQLNKLRKMNDIKKIEHEQKLAKVSVQYKPAEQDAGGGMGGM